MYTSLGFWERRFGGLLRRVSNRGQYLKHSQCLQHTCEYYMTVCVARHSIILRDGFLAEPSRFLVWSTGALGPLFTSSSMLAASLANSMHALYQVNSTMYNYVL